MAYLGNTLINGGLRCLNKAYFNDLSVGGAMEVASLSTTGNASIGGTLAVTGTSTLTGATTIAGTLTLTKTTDLSALIIGTSTSTHLAIDNDEIQAMTNASSVNDLYINRDGGTVYIPNLNSNNGVITNLNASETTTNNLVVNNTLKSFKWDISNVANLANDFMIAPTIEISSTGTVTISLVNSKYCFTFADSSTITTDEFAGCKWYSGAKVRFTAQINDVLLSNVEGTLSSNMNPTSGAVTISTDLTSDDISGLDVNTAYNASRSTIMLYEITQSGDESTTYPVGIHMTAYGTNNSYYIDMYGGNEPSFPTPVQPVFRIGNLGGITYNGSTLDSQWGVYTYNGFFEGAIVANSGLIGGFTIDNDRLYTGTLNETDGVLVTSGVTNNFNIGDSGTSSHTWAFTAKDAFGVTTDGTVYANDVNIGGTIKATSLYIGDYSGKVKDYLEYALDNTSNTYKLDLKTDWLNFNSETDTITVGDITGKNLSITDDAIYINNGSTPIASFGANQITLGIGENDIRNVITNTKISFQTDSGDLAYFGLNDDDIWEMHIGMTYADEMIRFGNYAWITRDNGNMTIKWLGE